MLTMSTLLLSTKKTMWTPMDLSVIDQDICGDTFWTYRSEG